jgi:geranylgeranyl pyrophosphate synthase
MDVALRAWADPRLEAVEGFLGGLFAGAEPEMFQAAVRYPLETGGKRIRPLLAIAAGEAVGGALDERLVRVAAAFELVHTYSLVHDDLPCMDDDDLRRGRPTVHKVFGDAAAVLVGDGLLTEAFAVLAAIGGDLAARLVGELARAAGHGGMIGGQADDIGMGGFVTDEAALRRLHARKTGALIRGAVRGGAIVGDAGPDDLVALTTYGEAVGLAFQLRDDLLDADQDTDEDGPPSFVRLVGPDATRRACEAAVSEAERAVAGLERPEALVMLARFAGGRTV